MDKQKVADLAKSFSRSCKELVNDSQLARILPSPAVTLIALTVITITSEGGFDKRSWSAG